MDSAKGKSKASRDEKLATAKLDEQIEKVSFFVKIILFSWITIDILLNILKY